MTTGRLLPRTSPESAGVSRAALERLSAELDDLGGVHTLLVVRSGAVVAECEWAPYRLQQRQMMFSASKAFTAFAIGCAVAEGLLSIDDRVADLLADEVPKKVPPELADVQVRHLLTMTLGQIEENRRLFKRWTRTILGQKFEWIPGSRFHYDSMATYLLAVILAKVTGQRLLDYLTPHLFEPLGIPVGGDDGVTWDQSPEGVDLGGFGLWATGEDLAKFGQLYLQHGKWDGRQLIPASWVDTMMSDLVDPTPMGWGPDWQQGYGYQMWRCQVNASRADGAFGQFSIVWPEHDLVVATTAGVGGSGPAGTQALLDRVWDCLENACRTPESGPIEADWKCVSEHRSLPFPDGEATSPLVESLNGTTYRISGRKDTVSFEFMDDGELQVNFSKPSGMTHKAEFRNWKHYQAPRPDNALSPAGGGPSSGALAADVLVPTAAAFAWTDANTLELHTYATRTPFCWTYRFTFTPAVNPGEAPISLALSVTQNVSFAEDTKISKLKAKRIPR